MSLARRAQASMVRSEDQPPPRIIDAQDQQLPPAALTAAAYERPKGAYAAVAAAALGTEITRLAITGGILAVEFASASARSDESLFHGLRGGRKTMSILMSSFGMVISSLAISLLTVLSLQPRLGTRNTMLWSFFAGSATFAVAEILSLFVLAGFSCEANGIYDSGEWVCDRAPAILGLGVPFAFPTIGCRVAVAWVAYKSAPDGSRCDEADAASQLPTVESLPLQETDVQLTSGQRGLETSLMPLSPDSGRRMSKRARESARQTGSRRSFRDRWRSRAGSGDSDSSGNDDLQHIHFNVTRNDRHGASRTLLESCLEHCEELDAEICTNSRALSGLERSVRAHQRRLDNEVRRLTKAMEAQKTHREGLEDRFQNVEARMTEHQEHLQRSQSERPQPLSLPSSEIAELRQEFDQALRLTMDGLQRRCDNLGHEVQHLMSSLGLARSGHQEAVLRSFRKQLVEVLTLPPKQQEEAHKLAFRLLRQASEVATLLCATTDPHGEGPAGSRIHRLEDMQRLRSKYESTRDLHDLVRVVINEKVREILEKPGHHAVRSLQEALQGSDPALMQGHGMSLSDSLSTCASTRDIGKVLAAAESPDAVSKQLFSEAVQSPPLHSPVPLPQFTGLPSLTAPRSRSQPPPFQPCAPALRSGGLYSGHRVTMSPQMPRRMPMPPVTVHPVQRLSALRGAMNA